VINSGVDHHCFGCGNLNPIGLQLRFRELAAGGVWAQFTPLREHEGYLGLTHGGILSSVLDEAMSWAITAEGGIGVTARMTVSFRRPARVGSPLRVTAQVTQRRSRLVDVVARLVENETDEIIAEAEGRFMRVRPEQAAAWRDSYGAQIECTPFGDAIGSRPEVG
jgi:uncharacterized protein (TIGR00369 family)